MKSTIALVMATATLSLASASFLKPAFFVSQGSNYYNSTEAISEFRFMSKMIYATYNGFARGLYRE